MLNETPPPPPPPKTKKKKKKTATLPFVLPLVLGLAGAAAKRFDDWQSVTVTPLSDRKAVRATLGHRLPSGNGRKELLPSPQNYSTAFNHGV